MDKKIWLITGPTGSGKTELSIHLAKQLSCAILSADSRQIYKEMSIGTAKPNKEILHEIPHYFIDHVSVIEAYDANKFCKEARAIIQNEFIVKNNIVVVGGTGFYVNALLHGLDDMPDLDPKLRMQLSDRLHTHGIVDLQTQLLELDEQSYHQIDIANPRRVMRALEYCIQTANKYSAVIRDENKSLAYPVQEIYIRPEREVLYHRINHRVDQMILQGLEAEVRDLITYRELSSLQTVGYREFFEFFDEKVSREDAIQKIKQHSRNYAKRQITWFNKFSNGKVVESVAEGMEFFDL